ncbi:MAG TPA: hypothetical protein GX747_01980 [Tenericutes bacterium]|nr:hypothetical protein [Mycoplasmatota bacterium]
MVDNIDIIYTKNTLYVNVFGYVDLNIIKTINNKLNNILKDFHIPNIVLDFKYSIIPNKNEIYEFLDNFNSKYICDVKIVEDK